MSTATNNLKNWLDNHPKAKQWTWFITLWLGGLLAVTAIAYPIKWLMALAR